MTVTRIFKNEDTLFKKAAELILKVAMLRIAETGRFSIALSGGNTPRKLYELLAHAPYSNKVNWKNIYVFWSDERHVPYSDPDNNSNMAMTSLLEHVPIPDTNIFRVVVDLEPAQAAAVYENTIKIFFGNEYPRFDMLLLGLGEDGHTASLFPGTDILQNKTDLVKEVYVANKSSWRISFTIKLINHAKNILFLVTGKEKATVLESILKRKEDSLPAQLVKAERGNKLYWFVDKEAAENI